MTKVDTGSVAQAYNKIANIYDKSYQTKQAEKENLYVIKDLLKMQLFYPNRNMLDLGCGTGLLLDILETIGLDPLKTIPTTDFVGVDIAQKMLDRAEFKYPQYTWKKFDYDKKWNIGRFDSIISLFSSCSYSKNLITLSSKIKNALKENGKYYIMLMDTEAYRNKPDYIMKNNKIQIHPMPVTKDLLEWIFKDFPNFHIKKAMDYWWIISSQRLHNG